MLIFVLIVVLIVQASPHHTELFAASYGASTSTVVDSSNSGGAVCLWSVLLPNSPEFVFSAVSPVLMVRFHPENVHILIGTVAYYDDSIFHYKRCLCASSVENSTFDSSSCVTFSYLNCTGACYSGQIVLWDTRQTTSHRPTQRSGRYFLLVTSVVHSLCCACYFLIFNSNVLLTAVLANVTNTPYTRCVWRAEETATAAGPLRAAEDTTGCSSPPPPMACCATGILTT